MKKILMLALFVTSSSQASSINPTKIVKILAGPDYGNLVFLAIDPEPADIPTCQTNDKWSYVFDGSTEAGKVYLSIALSAYAANKNVWFRGDNSCDLYSNVEDLGYIVSQ